MKKVLLSAYACSPYKGSEYCVGWSWAVELAKKGYVVWCFTNAEDWEDCEKEKQVLGLTQLHFIKVNLSFNLDGFLLDNSSKSIYLHYHLWKRKAATAIKKLHNIEQFDIAQHVSYGSFQQGSPLYKLEDCKIIFGPVGGGQMTLPIFKPFFKAGWYIEVIRKHTSDFLMRFNTSLNETLKKAELVLTVNEETEALLKSSKYFKKDSNHFVSDSALPKQFEANIFRKKEVESEFRILWVGRIIPRRGLELSIKALAQLPKHVNYKLVIVGDGEQGSQLKNWIRKHKINPSCIEHLGWVDYTEMHEEYRKADIMLFCPLRDTSGLQAIEAMGFGLPVITLNISGMRSIMPDNCGVKITPTTTEGTAVDIASAIEKMYVDLEFRRQSGENAFHHAMKNTWGNKIDTITKNYY